MIVAIDGPAGAGKSTVAKALAKQLGFQYFDSGAVYRALTYWALELLQLDLQKGLEPLIAKLGDGNLKVYWAQNSMLVELEGKDLSEAIRDPRITGSVGAIANNPACRSFVNRMMRDEAKKTSLVIDGRDIGSVVFPDAEHKFYLDADPAVRAERRAKELNIALDSSEFQALLSKIIERDENDKSRAIAPLVQAADAKYLDTTSMDMSQVVSQLALFVLNH